MDIAIIGAGSVGGTLGRSWAARGHKVCFGVRDPAAPGIGELLRGIDRRVRAMTVADAALAADTIVLATPWAATKDAMRAASSLKGKVVIDCTNPLTPDFATLTVGHSSSGAEQVAAWASGASVYKAFNQTGFNIMADPVVEGRRAVMFVCGDDAAQKPLVMKLVGDLGFEAIDAGDLIKARLLEPLALLWIHLAYKQNLGRDFAFGLLRRDPSGATS